MDVMSPVKRLALRWFKHFRSNFLFEVDKDPVNDEFIGSIPIGENGKCIELYEKNISISSEHFSGNISYRDISSCDKCYIFLNEDGLKHVDIYNDMDFIRSLTEDEILDLKRKENGVIIRSAGQDILVLVENEVRETVWEIGSYLSDFLRRVTVTKAWQD
ncbi:MAG: hypothetical protein QNJ29_06955 [Rhizobiaceae bacterium]|nr:hypothetical protein [Rhizobiaceae bacterium]